MVLLKLSLSLAFFGFLCGRRGHGGRPMDETAADFPLASAARKGQRCGRQFLLSPGPLRGVAPEGDLADQPGVCSCVLLGLQKL